MQFNFEKCQILSDEPNWEEQRLAIVQGRVLHIGGGRHRMLLNEEPNRHDSESSLPSTEPPDPSSEDEPDDGTGESFDTQLPTQHSVIISFVVLWHFLIAFLILVFGPRTRNRWKNNLR